MTAPTLEADPDCSGAASSSTRTTAPERPRLRAERRAFDSIPREDWDRLASVNPWATPFSSWAFHRAWWDGYGPTAHDQTMVVLDPARGPDADPVAIVPLMHRHVVEPTDEATHTTIRHGARLALTPVPPTAKAVYFGASYHADYATILADPLDLPEIAEAIARAFCAETETGSVTDPDHPAPWDVIDLRRLRAGDPAADALAVAFGRYESSEGWTLNLEREDVCPVATLPAGATFDDYLATLGKKERHEIRRKVRRAESHGPIELVPSLDPKADVDAFIDLHQARWGDDGLFPPTEGGRQSRAFFGRLVELCGGSAAPDGATSAPDGSATLGPVRLSFLTVGGRRIAAAVHFETDDSILYYNAGIDPEAFSLSPGVLLVERLVRRALETGRTRLDFLRGNEPYKYEWGAQDESIQRLLVRRSVA